MFEIDFSSKYKYINEYLLNDVPIYNQIHRIFGVVPSEMLHEVYSGISKYMFEYVHYVIEPNQS